MKNLEDEEENLQEQDDTSYTENEVEFADGKGTQLDEEIEVPDQEGLEENPDDDLDDEAETTQED